MKGSDPVMAKSKEKSTTNDETTRTRFESIRLWEIGHEGDITVLCDLMASKALLNTLELHNIRSIVED
jgi:hypothetical protein